MSHCILLADDSETIHKVMTYTFMNGPFELEVASTKDQVDQKLAQKTYDIILLDFGLSEQLNGYEVAKEVSTKANQSAIVMLFGSFDTINEGRLREAGVREGIIKPFDSQHLIKICEAIVQGKESVRIEENNSTPVDSNDQNWQIKKPTLSNLSSLNEEQLKKELKNWSVDIPPVINGEQVEQDLSIVGNMPPVIGEGGTEDITAQFKIPERIVKNQARVPLDRDLEYPESKIKSPRLPSGDELPDEKTEGIGLSSLNELDINFEKFDLNKTSPTLSVNKDELDEISPSIEMNDYGDNSDITTHPSNSVEGKVAAVPSDVSPLSHKGGGPLHSDKVEGEESLSYEVNSEDFWDFNEEDAQKNEDSGPISKELSIDPSKVDIDNIMERLRPFIEQSVHQYCKETIEKVAWEIIPDLAENIIKKEIQEIKDSIIK